jgi:stress-induced morphogen
MPLEQDKLQKILEAGFPDGTVVLEDIAGDNDHYRATITSRQFENKSRIEQHKLVHECLKNTEAHDLHALALRTQTPS